jgi:hypothetical protein
MLVFSAISKKTSLVQAGRIPYPVNVKKGMVKPIGSEF